MRQKVDPAALLVAVLAAGAGPFLEPGEWSLINTVTASIVLITVVCFSWPRNPTHPRDGAPDFAMLVAQSFVYSFILSVAVAWPIQELWRGHLPVEGCASSVKTGDEVLNQTNYLRNEACKLRNSELLADLAGDWALAVGLIGLIISFTLLLGAVGRIKGRLPQSHD